MVLKRFYDEKLAQASYLVGCSATGEAVVIDPNRDAAPYVAAAASEGLRIVAVTETHIHADFLSGSRELASRTGATMYLSDEGPADWKYAFASDPSVVLVKDGSVIRIGNVRLDVMHTPGHTPEHITFLLTDEPASPQPIGAFTGDFVFVGDVGRPDLLERAANIKGTMQVGGQQLYASIQRFSKNPDGLLIWPGHGAGSACGKSLGGVPVSSLGYEKTANWALRPQSENDFVEEVLSGQPDPPRYFATMKRLNKAGPAILGDRPLPSRLGTAELQRLVGQREQVVDVRIHEAIEAGFLPGTLLIPGTKSFTNWAGWLLDYGRPIWIIAEDEAQLRQAVKDLAMIGLDDVQGWFSASDLPAGIKPVEQLTAGDLAGWSDGVLDVRFESEFAAGHVPGAVNVPLGYLLAQIDRVPKGRTAVICGSGGRSLIAIGLLERLGFRELCNVAGGFGEYKCRGCRIDVGTDARIPATS